jgi:hypothetical protein
MNGNIKTSQNNIKGLKILIKRELVVKNLFDIIREWVRSKKGI